MALTLDEFIAETLAGIVKGIDSAKAKLAETGRDDWISPPIERVGEAHDLHDTDVSVYRAGGYTSKANVVRFDVALHATDAEETGGRVGVSAATMLTVSGGKKMTSEETSISRVKFEIPLVIAELPSDEIARRIEYKKQNLADL